MPFKGLQLIAQFNFQRAVSAIHTQKSHQAVPFGGQKTPVPIFTVDSASEIPVLRMRLNFIQSAPTVNKFFFVFSVFFLSKERHENDSLPRTVQGIF